MRTLPTYHCQVDGHLSGPEAGTRLRPVVDQPRRKISTSSTKRLPGPRGRSGNLPHRECVMTSPLTAFSEITHPKTTRASLRSSTRKTDVGGMSSGDGHGKQKESLSSGG